MLRQMVNQNEKEEELQIVKTRVKMRIVAAAFALTGSFSDTDEDLNSKHLT